MLNDPQNRLYGMPVFRQGDNVFLLGKMPEIDMTAADAMARRMECLMLSMYEYRCPFSLLEEFDRWWEWQKRTKFDGQTTGRVITTMLSDIDEIKSYKIEREITFRMRTTGDWLDAAMYATTAAIVKSVS